MDIKICKVCGGTGEVDKCTYYNESIMVECHQCHGTGRVLTRTYEYTIPYITDNMSYLYKKDSEICDTIRDLQKYYLNKKYDENGKR